MVDMKAKPFYLTVTGLYLLSAGIFLLSFLRKKGEA